MGYKEIKITEEDHEQIIRIDRAEGQVTITMECQIDLAMVRDELEEMGVLEELDEGDDMVLVVRSTLNHIGAFTDHISWAIGPTDGEGSDT